MPVTAPMPHTTGRLLVDNPDMAEILADVTLSETSLGLIRLYPDYNTANVHQFEYLMRL
jgi:hypothetical protein